LDLPLLPPAGEALLNYLRSGRPPAELREVFLRVRAPYSAFPWGTSLYTVIQRRLEQAGIKVKGRHGAHAFRFRESRQPPSWRCAVEVDWGDVDADDKERNEEALKDDSRIFTLRDGTRIYVTEADRSATTILLPEEY
jgi:hypothetical protein